MNNPSQHWLQLGSPQVNANCFNAVQLYFGDSKNPSLCGPEEFVQYIQTQFIQLTVDQFDQPDNHIQSEDVFIVWSRSTDFLPVGSIEIAKLLRDQPHYPFGLIIEHAFVRIDSDLVFQKPDPSPQSKYEVISQTAAINPYFSRPGFEITRHRRLSNH